MTEIKLLRRLAVFLPFLIFLIFSCKSSKVPELTEEQKCRMLNLSERYVCHKPKVEYLSETSTEFVVKWEICDDLSGCNYESMAGKGCFVPAYTDDASSNLIISKGSYSSNVEVYKEDNNGRNIGIQVAATNLSAGRASLLALDKYLIDKEIYKVNAYDAIHGDRYLYTGNTDLQTQWYQALRNDLSGYPDLTTPCFAVSPVEFKEPYIIEELCTPDATFRVTTGTDYITTERCSINGDPVYYMDIHSTDGWENGPSLDRPKGGGANRPIVFKVVLSNYDPSKKYALYVYQDDMGDKISGVQKLEWGSAVEYITPAKPPQSVTSIEATIKVYIGLGNESYPTMETKNYKAWLKTYSDDINAPGANAIAFPYTFQVKTRQRDGFSSFAAINRSMNLYLYTGGSAPISTDLYKLRNIKDFSFGGSNFENHFKNALSNSDAHIISNYMPNSLMPGKANPTPIGSSVPTFLVDKDGYGVLLVEDLSSSTVNMDVFTEAVSKWKFRLHKCFHYDRIKKPITKISDLIYGPYDFYSENAVSVLVINTFKFYTRSGDVLTATTDPKYSKYVENYGTGRFAQTSFANSSTQYNPICIIYWDEAYFTFSKDYPSNVDGQVLASVFHELAHAWNNRGVCDYSKASHDAQHTPYIKGENMTYCLMRSKPGSGSTDPASLYRFLIEKQKQMRYSDGILQRLSNVLIPTY